MCLTLHDSAEANSCANILSLSERGIKARATRAKGHCTPCDERLLSESVRNAALYGRKRTQQRLRCTVRASSIKLAFRPHQYGHRSLGSTYLLSQSTTMAMSYALDVFRQCFFIPKPTLTEQNLPDQTGRVAIVTGGYSGAGKALCTILYRRNATVYIAGRSATKYDDAVAHIRQACPQSKGRLEFLRLDLSDLRTIKPAVESFMTREQSLHVLTNNAGAVSMLTHGYENGC